MVTLRFNLGRQTGIFLVWQGKSFGDAAKNALHKTFAVSSQEPENFLHLAIAIVLWHGISIFRRLKYR